MMDRLLQHSGWLKLFSVALAILLWAMVLPTYMAETSRTFDVPLKALPHPSFQLLEGPRDRNQTVQIRADGKSMVLSRLKREQFSAYVDYARVTEPGKPTVVEVVVEGPERKGVQYTASPGHVTATLIQTTTREFEIVTLPGSSGLVAVNGREYRYSVQVEEPLLRLTGRSDVLAQVRYGQVTLEEGDLRPSVTEVTKPVIPVDAAGDPVEKLEQQQAVVRLTWEELPPGRFFRVEPVTVGNVPNGFVVTGMDLEPARVSVRAVNVNVPLPEGEVVETAPIDLTNRTVTFTTTVRLVPPGETTLGAQTVNVRVKIAEVTVEKVLQHLPIAIRNQAVNSEVTLGTADVTVRLKGPYSVMSVLDASALDPFIDLEGVRDGRHLLPVKLTWPPGVTEVDMDPSLVEAVITVP